MEQHHTNNERDDEIVPFIGIPRKWANPAVKVYAIIFFAYGIWIGFHKFGSSSKSLIENLDAFYPHLAAFSVVEAITFVSLIQLGDIIMYLTSRFRTHVAKIRAEGVAEGRAEGIEQGIAEAYRQWQAWNTRRIAAEAKDEPFDEPPPTPPKTSKNGTPPD